VRLARNMLKCNVCFVEPLTEMLREPESLN